MRRSFSFAVALAVVLHVVVSAQSPHGAPTATPQPGPNVNTAAGIVANPFDPAAFLKSDLLLQRQNETVVAASSRNPDHILAAANDYRFVDFPDDQHFGEQGFIARLIAKLFRRPSAPVPTRAAAAVGGWTGIYRSCDHGGTWIGGALPGSPLDSTPISLASPMKQLSNLAELQGAHAETTDPVLVSGPSGRVHVIVLGFIRFPNGQVGESRVYYASYTDRNNREGGTCFNYDYATEVDRSTRYTGPGATAPFIDKPSAAIDKDGTLFVSYTVFSDGEKSKIVVARSSTNGASWTRTSPLLSIGVLKNHGTSTVVDPLSGEVFVAWRIFFENWPMMVISRSINSGRTFLPGTPISHLWPTKSFQQIVQQLKAARLQPFDQFNNAPNMPATARSLAFPNIVAGVVGGRTKLFAVWTERADVDPASPTYGLPSATGSPRIMLSTSTDGFSWTQRRAIDAAPRTENSLQAGLGPMVTRPSGPQLQPVLNLSGTANPQLLVAYYEARDELEPPFANSFVSGIARQMDVRVARINPATGQLLAPSTQVSQYSVETNSSPGKLAETAPGYAAVNRGNLLLYSGGRNAFFGDYLWLASSSVFEWASGAWKWATDPSSALTIWTDSRNARFPLNSSTQQPDINGDWTAYTPLRPALPATPPTTCGNVGMRDSNPYFSEIGGIVAGSPQTFKPLTVQRAFVAYVSNRTPVDRSFRLQILDNEAGGLDGSFDQFAFGAAGDIRDVRVFANSSNVQTVWVQPNPANPTASVRVRVDEINTPGGSIIANGLKATIVLNPDPNNDALTAIPTLVPGFDGNPSGLIDHTELHNPQISTPQISTFTVKAPQISSPQISTPQISTPQISTPQISTPQISTPQISTPQISTPQISTPQISTPQIATVLEGDNGTDVTYTVNNVGNTWTAYNVVLNVPNVDALLTSGNYQFQVIVTRTSLAQGFAQTPQGCVPAAVPQVQVLANIPVPATGVPQISTIRNPQIATPQIATPQIATFALGPLGGVTGQNDPAAAEIYGAVLPDEVKVTLRAIRLTPAASGGPTFDPAAVVLKAQSQSTNVINGVPGANGTQPAVVKAGGVFVTQPSSAGTNVPITPIVRVLVRDNTGAVVPGATVVLTLSTNPSGATLTGNSATSGVDGIAQFPLLAVNQPGTGYILQAAVGSNILGQSAPFDIGGAAMLVVSNTADSGPGSLRQAIINANANAPALDTITFNISGSTQIVLASNLPAITDGVHIDGTTQPGYPSTRVWVNGGGMPGAGFAVSAGHTLPSSIRGLAITGFAAHAIRFNSDGNGAAGNLIGLTPAGVAAPNGEGVFVDGGKNNIIGGPLAGDRNVISGNSGHGVLITGGADATGNQVIANYIGTNVDGTGQLANGGVGVFVSAPSFIGAPGLGNLISGNNQGGISVQNDDSQSTIQGNFIGTNAAGTLAIANLLDGIAINDAEFSLIGGTASGAGNVISGNLGSGISLTGDASATTIQGNIIGLNAAGNARLGNGGVGVFASSSPSAMIGGTTSAARNIISGNTSDGVTLLESNNSDIVGNYIGTDITGTVDLGNTLNGVFVDETSNSRVGGDVSGAGNLLSGNGENGVFIDADSDNITVAGNRIGTNAAGTAALPNGHVSGPPAFDFVGAGIVVHGASHSIGSPEPLGGNLIAGNPTAISVNGTLGLQILNNTIGLNAAGTGVIANSRFGIFLADATSTLVGGTAEFTHNVISGSVLQGIVVSGTGSTGVTIVGNYIGTNAAGNGAAANGQQGILVQSGAVAAMLNNVVSGNSNGGIRLQTNGNTVRGNRIGTAVDGTTALGNGSDGISIVGSSNVVGSGDNPNTIAFNTGNGVSVSGGSGNSVTENSIFGNGLLGIDLDSNGVTANDPVDADSGANDLQNYPDLASANSTGTVTGTLNSSVNSTFLLRFFSSAVCDGSGNGEGRTWIGSTTVTTNANGSAPFNAEVGLLTVGEAVTATATDTAGNTSEFSGCRTVVPSHEPAPGLVRADSGSWLQAPAGILRERVGRVGVRAQLQK